MPKYAWTFWTHVVETWFVIILICGKSFTLDKAIQIYILAQLKWALYARACLC